MNTFTRILHTLTLLLVAGALPMAAVGQSVQYTDDVLRYNRPVGQDGVTTFEPSMEDDTPYDGFAVKLGGAFAQQLQGITQSNDAGDLTDIGRGFNLATANLDLDAQMAEGIRLHVRTYLSSRHHPEAWVKGGYLQVNELPFDGLDGLMRNVSIRAGHFMPNYGDTHFRRTDNADAIQNPFIGNNIVDAFTTEVGAEATAQSNGFLAVGGFGGQLNPTVENPDDRAPSFYGKVGYDDEATDGVRVRLTGSVYYTSESNSGQLHSGDRAGSRYYNVVSGGDWSGRLRVNYGDQVTAFMVNPFVKVGGLELFGTIETIGGEAAGNNDARTNQYAAEAVYRVLNDNLFVGARYNTVTSDRDLGGDTPDWNEVSIDRWQLGAGWFMTKNILVKAEYVTQSYNDYPSGATEAGAEFDGVMVEGVVSF
ncbi:MAG: hypothetical protein R6T83_05540 [Salinibacter sp.]